MRNGIKTAFALGFSLLAMNGFSQEKKLPHFQKVIDNTTACVYTNHNGNILRYRYGEPKQIEKNKKYPLVVLLHGAGERGTNNISQLVHGALRLFEYCEKNKIGFYFIAGQVAPNEMWVNSPWNLMSHRMPQKPSNHTEMLFNLLDEIAAKNVNVDTSRIYVTGISMGGYGTWDVVQRRPDFWAAAIPVCGGGDSYLAYKIREVPIWAFHGSADGAVPVSRTREMVAALWQVNGNIRYTEYPGMGHGCWVPVYDANDTWKWLFSQRNKKKIEKVKTDANIKHVRFVPGDKTRAEISFGGCSTAGEYLERVRDTGAKLRTKFPGVKVIGTAPNTKFINDFLATGEIEEIDAWQLMSISGKAPRQILAAGYDRAFLMDGHGNIMWSRAGCGNIHRVQKYGEWIYYSNGDLWRVSCEKKDAVPELVYRPKNRKGGGVLGFEIRADQAIVMAVNSTSEIIDIDTNGREVARFKVKAENGGDHGKLRMVHRTPAGNYLVCAAGDQAVREYNAKGELVWEQKVPVFAFDAVRCKNGNTIVSHVTGLTEYTPNHKVVRKFKPADFPALKISNLTGLELRPNGNVVVGTWQNGKSDCSQVTAFELTPNNKIVWSCAMSDANMMSASVIQ